MRAFSAGADGRNSETAAFLLVVALLTLAGCAARRPRSFSPASGDDTRRALAAWNEAVARSNRLAASRLLYEARLTQGLARIPGTLAIKETPRLVEASLTGPFGSPVATYANGALRGEKIKPLTIDPLQLRAMLAGAWTAPDPEVRGVDGGDALLAWEGREHVEAILDIRRARFRSLSVARPDGKVTATYSGEFDPWPSRIELEDAASGGRLRLRLLDRESLE